MSESGTAVRRVIAFAGLLIMVWFVWGTMRACRTPQPITALKGTEVYYYVTPETEFDGDISTEPLQLQAMQQGLVLRAGRHLLSFGKGPNGWKSLSEPTLLADEVGKYDEWVVDAAGAVFTLRERVELGSALDSADIEALESQKGLAALTGSGTQLVGMLPRYGMKLAASQDPGYIYAFDSNEVYLLSDDGLGARRIALFPGAHGQENASLTDAESYEAGLANVMLQDLCEAPDGYYVAAMVGYEPARTEIFQVSGAESRRVYQMPTVVTERETFGVKDREFDEEGTREPAVAQLTSLGCTSNPDLLFFATGSTVYALAGATAIPITRDLGGEIRWHDGILFVLDAKRRMLVGIAGLEEALKASPEAD